MIFSIGLEDVLDKTFYFGYTLNCEVTLARCTISRVCKDSVSTYFDDHFKKARSVTTIL